MQNEYTSKDVSKPISMGYYRLENEDLERLKVLNSSAISVLIYLELKKIMSLKKNNKDFVDITDKNFMSLLGNVSRTGFKAARKNLIEKDVITMTTVEGHVKRYTINIWKNSKKNKIIKERMRLRYKTINSKPRKTRNVVNLVNNNF